MVLASTVAPVQCALRGVVAGCGFATTVIRVFGLYTFDAVSAPAHMSLLVCIDETGLGAVGPGDSVAQGLTLSGGELHRGITHMLVAGIAIDK
eukprot:4409958-Pyramimonas_sp.AAC.1